jgi:hypothetical protein
MIKVIEYLVEQKRKFEYWFAITQQIHCIKVHKDMFSSITVVKSDSDYAEQYGVFQNGVEIGYINLDEIKEYLKLGDK